MVWTEDTYKDYYDGVWRLYTAFQWGNNDFNWEDWSMNATVFNEDSTPSTTWDLDRRTTRGNKRLNELTQLNDPDETFGGDSISDFQDES